MRHRAKLDQVVCTLEGMATLLQRTPGDFAVVIHGDADCAAVLVHGVDHPGAERFYCTQLSADEAVAGRGLAVLEPCLEALCDELGPAEIFVLGTCLSALTGEEADQVTRRVAQARGARVTPLEGAGMRFVSQAAVLDRFACLVCEGAPEAQPQPTAVNLVGFDPGAEVLAQLSALGIAVNAVLDVGAPMADWQRAGRAAWNLLLDEPLFSGFVERWQSQGVQPLTVPYPMGAAATDRFFEAVVRAVCPGADTEAVLGPARDAAHRAVAEAAPACRGKRLGYNLGSKKNLEATTLACAGLAERAAFEELGLELRLLVQGDDRPERLEALRGAVAAYGCEAPLAVFSDTVYFADLCRAEEVALVYASDHLQDQARLAGVGFVAQSTLRPGYGGVAPNLQRIRTALSEGERP